MADSTSCFLLCWHLSKLTISFSNNWITSSCSSWQLQRRNILKHYWTLKSCYGSWKHVYFNKWSIFLDLTLLFTLYPSDGQNVNPGSKSCSFFTCCISFSLSSFLFMSAICKTLTGSSISLYVFRERSSFRDFTTSAFIMSNCFCKPTLIKLSAEMCCCSSGLFVFALPLTAIAAATLYGQKYLYTQTCRLLCVHYHCWNRRGPHSTLNVYVCLILWACL